MVETTTVPEITTVAEIIEEGDSDGDDSVRLKIIKLIIKRQLCFNHLSQLSVAMMS